MAWTESSIFRAHLSAALEPETGPGIPQWGGVAQAYKVALFDLSAVGVPTTPDKTVARAATAYNGGVWIPANEVVDSAGTEWPATGLPLTWALATRFTSAGADVIFDADDTASTGLVTLANVHGDLVYNDAMADKAGAAYHWFGGPQQVTSGTFTIIWADPAAGGGIMRVEV